MNELQLQELQSKMAKSLEITRIDLGTIRTGRATPSLIENVVISVYGGSQKLKIMELATITSPDHATLVLIPYDISIIDEIGKGLAEAQLGFNPSVDGEVVRITIPPLSEERRREFIKFAQTKIEAGKVMMRQIRHEGMSTIKKALDAKEITEDDRKRLERRVQELTDDMVGQLDSLGAAKEKELLQV